MKQKIFALAAMLIVAIGAWAGNTITKVDTENGSFTVTVGGEEVAEADAGLTVTITATPATGYEVDGAPVVASTTAWENAQTRTDIPVEKQIEVKAGTAANTWTFTMPSDKVSVSVKFKKTDYTITVAEITGGSVSVKNAAGEAVTTAQMGDEISVSYETTTGWELVELSVKSGETAIMVTDGKFTMPAGNVSISATFKKIDYAVTIAEGIENGTVAADKTTAQVGDEVTLTITPATGYVLDALTVKDAAGNAITVTDGKFTMPAGNVSISATFKKIDYAVTIAEGIENGTVAA
ncbi:MAG: hypothetical protein IJQ60_17940, partial [Prevotella sp.]|nr:hypothetical protein [Prevotella sp.]